MVYIIQGNNRKCKVISTTKMKEVSQRLKLPENKNSTFTSQSYLWILYDYQNEEQSHSYTTLTEWTL